jgi:hypothetical protein
MTPKEQREKKMSPTMKKRKAEKEFGIKATPTLEGRKAKE